jgi:hypothetical protein
MIKKYLITALTLFALLSQVAIAANVNCGPLSVLAVQAEENTVHIRVKHSDGRATWKTLGKYSDGGIKSYQAVAQQALATKAKIYLRYAVGYDCFTYDTETRPMMIRIIQ